MAFRFAFAAAALALLLQFGAPQVAAAEEGTEEFELEFDEDEASSEDGSPQAAAAPSGGEEEEFNVEDLEFDDEETDTTGKARAAATRRGSNDEEDEDLTFDSEELDEFDPDEFAPDYDASPAPPQAKQISVVAQFMQRTSETLTLLWQNPDSKQEVKMTDLAPNATFSVNTHSGQTFFLRKGEGDTTRHCPALSFCLPPSSPRLPQVHGIQRTAEPPATFTTIPDEHQIHVLRADGVAKALPTGGKVQVSVENKTPQPVKIFWRSPDDGREVQINIVEPGKSNSVDSFAYHTLIVRPDENGEALLTIHADEQAKQQYTVGQGVAKDEL
eukprot:TRINITY_DN17599_c0_g1_i2.p1 TRINITY_DN17599_c0_g1~~TRINITY_DN17599_c0_g1_i2.p1  ORF type:complete len:329 (+),score=90.96 TRINITY_DN17599_c0_g1_i2:88-1074(+)